MQYDRLTMPIGEAMFTQRSTRKLRPDPIPVEDLHLIMEAAVKAPNGGNHQVGRFLIVNDRAKIREFGALYKEAWWAKRWDDHKWTKPEDIPLSNKNYRSAMGLAEDMKDVPCVVFAFTAPGGQILHFCIPMGYPAVKYGPSKRLPTTETTSLNRWGGAVPWR